MAKKKITKKELKNRIAYISLAFFTFYIVEPIRDKVGALSSEPTTQIFIGGLGILITLWLFRL